MNDDKMIKIFTMGRQMRDRNKYKWSITKDREKD